MNKTNNESPCSESVEGSDVVPASENSLDRILFAVHLDSLFTGLFGVALSAKEQGRFAPLVFFSQPYRSWKRDSRKCIEHKIRVLNRDTSDDVVQSTTTTTDAGRTRRALRRIKRIVFNSFVYQYVWLFTRILSVRAVIRKERIKLIVLGGDFVHYDTSAFVEAGHAEGIPVVVIAGWMIKHDNAEAFMFEPLMQAARPCNAVVSRLFPNWLYQYKGRRLLRLPAGALLARELLGLAPPSPWTLHSGQADRIAVESEETRDACIGAGLPPDKICITGSSSHDTMYKYLSNAVHYRQKLYCELGFSNTAAPLLLSAIPPDEFYRPGGRPECDFSYYSDLVEFWIRSLTRIKGWNIVVCLHPSVLFEDMQFIENWGVKISRRHTSELISLCDLYVASGSTTIQWATACAKPVLNYDVYRYRHQDFSGIPGMITTEEQKDFIAMLERLTGDPLFYAEMVRKQQSVMKRWGLLDGHANDRLHCLFDSLIRERRSSA